MTAHVNETNHSMSTIRVETMSDESDEENLQFELSARVHRELNSAVTVPVSFSSLPFLIDELWKTFIKIGGEEFREVNTETHKNILKKLMLIFAEAKVCCAQRTSASYEDLPQKRLYFYEELIDLSSLVKNLPYPLAMYLDCIGNTKEGKLNVTPVLAELAINEVELAGAISYSPRQFLPFLLMLKEGIPKEGGAYLLARQLKLPKFMFMSHCNGDIIKAHPETLKFWLTGEENISPTANDVRMFKQIINCFNNKGFNIETNLLDGEGSMAQTVQTPNWYINRPFRYFCMADISEHDQKIGAFFGFNFNTHGVQESRYGGSFKTAYWQGEVVPRQMMKSILENQQIVQEIIQYSRRKRENIRRYSEELKMVTHIRDMNDLTTKLTEAGDRLVVIEFFASWCRRSMNFFPQLEELAKEHTNILILRVDVDECEDIAFHYEIFDFPTFVFIKREEKITSVCGTNYNKLNSIILDWK